MLGPEQESIFMDENASENNEALRERREQLLKTSMEIRQAVRSKLADPMLEMQIEVGKEKKKAADWLATRYYFNRENDKFEQMGGIHLIEHEEDFGLLMVQKEFRAQYVKALSRNEVRVLILDHEELNDEQKEPLTNILVKEYCMSFVIAPPGTGKTYLLGEYVRLLRKKHPRDIILVVSATNLNAIKMAEEIYRAANSKGEEVEEMVILQSTYAAIAELGTSSNVIY